MNSSELFEDVGSTTPPKLTPADPVKIKWRHGDNTRVTRLLLERFLQHPSVLERHKPFQKGDRLQTRALDTRMITNDWCDRDALLTEKGARILNAAARQGYGDVIREVREHGVAEWLNDVLEDST